MKKNDLQELKNKSIEDLKKEVDLSKNNLQEIIQLKNLGKLQKTHLTKITKRQIARLLTLINQKNK